VRKTPSRETLTSVLSPGAKARSPAPMLALLRSRTTRRPVAASRTSAAPVLYPTATSLPSAEVVRDGPGEAGVAAHLGIEVGPNPNHHCPRARQQHLNETRPLIGVVPLRVELFELIDHSNCCSSSSPCRGAAPGVIRRTE